MIHNENQLFLTILGLRVWHSHIRVSKSKTLVGGEQPLFLTGQPAFHLPLVHDLRVCDLSRCHDRHA